MCFSVRINIVILMRIYRYKNIRENVIYTLNIQEHNAETRSLNYGVGNQTWWRLLLCESSLVC